ncbi:TerB family tellurite resistance protein [Burkholderia diffusa]|uniref:TerB family tellurite resistance protein n=1 Tax=Burkholderia diffusa TaxID=488732 RepID=UPI00157A7E81|nr:TerB family tellurite resistance protein [Burkholderia diffusa]NTY38215.1 TerB family tellurite resistance protein [Burkholderia diffusa]
MRSYPRNSPQAAARIVALVLGADGHHCSVEDQMLERLEAAKDLGLTSEEFREITQIFFEDRILASYPASIGGIDAATRTAIVDEVDDPRLRRKLLRICSAVITADNFLADGEIVVLAAILRQWHLDEAD